MTAIEDNFRELLSIEGNSNLSNMQFEHDWEEYELAYDFAKMLVKENRPTGTLATILTDYYEGRFKQISEEYDQYNINWIFEDKLTGNNIRVSADADSWNDDGCFGDNFSFEKVYPKEVTKTIYVTKDEL